MDRHWIVEGDGGGFHHEECASLLEVLSGLVSPA